MTVFLKHPTLSSTIIKCVRNDKKTQFCTETNGLCCKISPALTYSLSVPKNRTTACNLICNVNAGVIFQWFYQMNNTHDPEIRR